MLYKMLGVQEVAKGYFTEALKIAPDLPMSESIGEREQALRSQLQALA